MCIRDSNNPRYRCESDPPIEKRLNRKLIGGIQGRRRAMTGAQGAESQIKTGETLEVRALKMQ